MRKIVLSFVCVLACLAGLAQGVKFESGTWEEILAKAKAENKLVFVDVYTTWCGPCKHVSANVFPQEKMGTYYNTRFINFKMDAETPEGKKFVKTYPVQGYPSFFFIDGNGEVIHKIIGAKDADSFIAEAEMLSMYARHGGFDKMMASIENGTASKELLYDYYQSANKGNKPKALNLYLKALPAKELIDVNNKLIFKISLYDKELITRLVDEIVKASNDGRFSNGESNNEFTNNIVTPVQDYIGRFIRESVNDGNEKWFNELLGLKERFANYGGQRRDGGQSLGKDLRIASTGGEFLATPTYNKLCFWAKNRTNTEEFKSTLVPYMEKLLRENPVDCLLKDEQNTDRLEMIKKYGIDQFGFEQRRFDVGNITAHNIILWTDYFWKYSPSDKTTKALCSKWVTYAFNINPYNDKVALAAADFLARIGNFKEAKIVLEKAIACQKELKNDKGDDMKNLEWELRNLKNEKL